MPLLLQIYAPLNSINDQAYHRMIFVLCCKDPKCHKSPSPPYGFYYNFRIEKIKS